MGPHTVPRLICACTALHMHTWVPHTGPTLHIHACVCGFARGAGRLSPRRRMGQRRPTPQCCSMRLRPSCWTWVSSGRRNSTTGKYTHTQYIRTKCNHTGISSMNAHS